MFFLTRGVLLVTHLAEAEVGLLDVLRLYAFGFVYDLVFLSYVSLRGYRISVALPTPDAWLKMAPTGVARFLCSCPICHAVLAMAEWLFWTEFGVRFNFIAVDYLVYYSKEVINNILESYDLPNTGWTGLPVTGIVAQKTA